MAAHAAAAGSGGASGPANPVQQPEECFSFPSPPVPMSIPQRGIPLWAVRAGVEEEWVQAPAAFRKHASTCVGRTGLGKDADAAALRPHRPALLAILSGARGKEYQTRKDEIARFAAEGVGLNTLAVRAWRARAVENVKAAVAEYNAANPDQQLALSKEYFEDFVRKMEAWARVAELGAFPRAAFRVRWR